MEQAYHDTSMFLIESDIHAYLKKHENKELLRFITCGSVDDGKSTLIGRLLYETKAVFRDHLLALKAEKKYKRTEDEIDFSLLIDGLQAEREQGITIDVAYRYFTTEKRKFIIADTPGHEQYTRNMVTGASNADVGVILIDARNGVLTQTKRHTFLVTLLGIRSLIITINKMDLVGYSEVVYNNIKRDYIDFIEKLKTNKDLELNLNQLDLYFVPISALKGDNVVEKSKNMRWYNGKTFIEYLDNIEIPSFTYANINNSFRFPVQYVNRPNQDFRGYCGTITSGNIKVGDKITILPSKVETKISTIIPPAYREREYQNNSKNSKLIPTSNIENIPEASFPMAITLLTEDEVDISRGDLIVKNDDIPNMGDAFDIYVIWMSAEPLIVGKIYDIKLASSKFTGYIEEVYYKIDINTLEKIKANNLGLNEIAFCKVTFSKTVAFDPYYKNRYQGGFIFIDRITNNTVGAGLIWKKAESKHIMWHKHKVSKEDRVRIKGHKPALIWFTGLSGSGKSTISNELELALNRKGIHTFLLDGDNIRHGLNKDLGFSDQDRKENIRRIAEVGKLFVDAGLIVITAFISPFKEDRDYARNLVKKEEFIEVFVDAPLEVCEKRDPKGLYRKARRGIIPNFTGIDSPYEPPSMPEIHLKTAELSVEECVEKVLKFLESKELIFKS